MGRRKTPLSIGIIGGAGPMASVLFHQQIVEIAVMKYRCRKDQDFPRIVHISYPFADMLSLRRDNHQKQVEQQLSDCFDSFRQLKIDLIGIACNTLHSYLTKAMLKKVRLIHIVDVAGKDLFLTKPKKVLVCCTSTSRSSSIYQNIPFPATYPQEADQKKIDRMIQRIVQGKILQADRDLLSDCLVIALNNQPDIQAVVLGCTELSELHNRYPLLHHSIQVVDPMKSLAEKLCEKAFLPHKRKSNDD